MALEVPPRLARHIAVKREQAQAIIQKGPRQANGFLTETDAAAVVAAYGIRVNPTEPVDNLNAAAHQAEKMGFPVAMKVVCPDISHKTEANGVQLDLRSVDDVLRGYRNRPPVDMEQLTEMLLRLAQLVIDFPQIAELDLNPVVVKDSRPPGRGCTHPAQASSGDFPPASGQKSRLYTIRFNREEDVYDLTNDMPTAI